MRPLNIPQLITSLLLQNIVSLGLDCVYGVLSLSLLPKKE